MKRVFIILWIGLSCWIHPFFQAASQEKADGQTLDNKVKSFLVDFVFCDADKDWYKNYFIALLPKLKVGGCYTAHNVSDSGGGMSGTAEFYSYVKSLMNLKKAFYNTVHGPNHHWWVFSVTGLGSFMTMYDLGAVSISLPRVMASFQTGLGVLFSMGKTRTDRDRGEHARRVA